MQTNQVLKAHPLGPSGWALDQLEAYCWTLNKRSWTPTPPQVLHGYYQQSPARHKGPGRASNPKCLGNKFCILGIGETKGTRHSDRMFKEIWIKQNGFDYQGGAVVS